MYIKRTGMHSLLYDNRRKGANSAVRNIGSDDYQAEEPGADVEEEFLKLRQFEFSIFHTSLVFSDSFDDVELLLGGEPAFHWVVRKEEDYQ